VGLSEASEVVFDAGVSIGWAWSGRMVSEALVGVADVALSGGARSKTAGDLGRSEVMISGSFVLQLGELKSESVVLLVGGEGSDFFGFLRGGSSLTALGSECFDDELEVPEGSGKKPKNPVSNVQRE
jgi:hypothetical protein